MDELKKLLENAGVPVSEDEYGRDQGALNEPSGEPDEELLAHFSSTLDELLSELDSDIAYVVDEYDMHEGFRKSLKHQAKKIAEQKLYEWTRAEIEYLTRLPKSQGGDLPD